VDELPPLVPYLAAGFMALFVCVLFHLMIHGVKTRNEKRKGRDNPEALPTLVAKLSEQVTVLAASPGISANSPEVTELIQNLTAISIQQIHLSGELGHFVSDLRHASATGADPQPVLRQLLAWSKANHAKLITPLDAL
jgi:hypothetical protein